MNGEFTTQRETILKLQKMAYTYGLTEILLAIGKMPEAATMIKIDEVYEGPVNFA